MKINKAVIAEQHLTFSVSVEDLKALLPRPHRKMVENGATFHASVKVGECDAFTVSDGALVLSVFQRSAPKETEAEK